MTAENDTSFTESTPPSPAPDHATAIEAGSQPTVKDSITLAPIPAPPAEPISPEELAQEMDRLDWVLSVLVVGLGFLLASFAIRNSDFFLHLAQGRLYAHGHFGFGTDPFSYTKTNYWANTSWLYDFFLYGITTILGGVDSPVAGVVLVVIKGLLIALLAGFMLKTSRADLPRWTPALCTGLALVVMSPRFFYQPTLISFLFLAITLYILQRPRHEEGSGSYQQPAKSRLRIYWALPVLFALWANLDAWWLLGPATVALFLLGQALQRILMPLRTGEDAPEPAQLTTLLGVLVIGLGAGLLNPHHYHAFALPAAVSPKIPAEVYSEDRAFKLMFQQPHEYLAAGQGTNAAGVAYFILLGAGLLSFGMNLFGEWRWWRLTVWLAFALLTFYRARTIPFFAVVAGPITALNLQDFAAANFGRLPRVSRGWRAFSLGGRIVSLIVAVLVMLAAWPGWLHGRPTDPSQGHRVGWELIIDPSLRATAEELRNWRAQGAIKDDENGFNFSPEVAHYCAWFASDPQTGLPREKSFLDYRLELFPRSVAQSYFDIRLGLIGAESLADSSARPVNWQEVFRKQHITHVLVNCSDQVAIVTWQIMLQDWSQWALVSMPQGRTLVFRWIDPLKRTEPMSQIPRLDLNAAAFGPSAVRAPATAPSQNVQPQDLIARFLHGPPPQSTHEDEAARYIEYAGQIQRRWLLPFLVAFDVGNWTGTVGMSGSSPAVGTVAAPGTFALSSLPVSFALLGAVNAVQFFKTGKDYGPPAAPVLAVRAARQAIADSPNNHAGYLRLATGYGLLWREQEESWVARPTQGLAFLRQELRVVQMVTALEHGLKLRPNDFFGQKSLYELYALLNYNDLALEHAQAMINLSRSPNVGEDREQFRKRREVEEKGIKEFETKLMRARNDYELGAANKTPLEKAGLALEHGLARKALEVLDTADVSQMNYQSIDLQIRLHLTTGASSPSLARGLDELRDALTGVASQIGPNYERYGFLLEAAAGNYADADKFMEEAIRKLELEIENKALLMVRGQAFGGIGVEAFMQSTGWLQKIPLLADYRVMRAMVALEAGDTALAARFCAEALNTNNGQPFDFESKMIAVNYLRLLKAAGSVK